MHLLRSPSRPPGSHPAPSRLPAALALGVLAALTLVACSTERGERRRFMSRIAPPQPLLTATVAYGNGAVTVQSWLGPSVRLRPAGERPSAMPSHSRDRITGGIRPFSEGGSAFSRDEIDEMYGHVDYQYMRPPRLALTFTFTNTSSAPVTFRIANVDSTLGNYAARPESFTLAPGQEGSPDPMLSPIENNFDQLDVTLTLKLGSASETHVMPLRPAPGTPPAPRGAARPE